MSELGQIFGADGTLASKLPGYRVRDAQVQLSEEIAQTVQAGEILVAEAGTGIGKTWAYLIPALLYAQKALVSTGTRTLQDQLYLKDLPQIRKALGVGGSTAILKGRGNYVCHYHLARVNEDPAALTSRAQVSWLRKITRFTAASATGDKAELADVPEDADIWRLVTSTRESCLGQDCPNISECFLYKARRQAQQADLVVINHALFMADAALRDEGVSELLPTADLVVFDEAHQLPDVATRFLAQSLSTAQLQELARQVEAAGLAHARETVDWSQLCAELVSATRELRLACEWMATQAGMRAMHEEFMRVPESVDSMQRVAECLTRLFAPLVQQEQRHPDLATQMRLVESYLDRLRTWQAGEGAQETVNWVELTAQHLRMSYAPLSIAQAFSRERQDNQAWVFLSATLSVKGDFSHFVSRLGLQDARTVRHASPFNYQACALLCVPNDLPAVDRPGFHAEFARCLFPVIQASEGACLILCTTLRAIDLVADELQLLFEQAGLDWPILRQGHQPRSTLLQKFRAQPRSVLVGSASFREGVDLVGEQLTVVAIDKLPFAPPDDPVLQARIRACRQKNGNPFLELQVPEAAIALKQGAGRLIRSEKDWGVLIIGDRRLVEKPYGRALWQGLPPFRRTRLISDVIEFVGSNRNQG